MGIDFSDRDMSFIIAVRKDVEDLLSDPRLKAAFNFAVLHELHHINLNRKQVEKFVNDAIAMNLTNLPRHALEWFAELLIAEGFNNEYLLDMLQHVAERDEYGRYMVVDDAGVLPVPGVVWILPHDELREISQQYLSTFPVLRKPNHLPYFTYTEPCVWKALAWNTEGNKPPKDINEALRAMTFDFQVARMLSHIKYEEQVLKRITADQAKDWLIEMLIIACGLNEKEAEEVAEEMARRKAVIYEEIHRKITIEDPAGKEPCVFERIDKYMFSCSGGCTKREEEGAGEEREKKCTRDRRIIIEIDKKKIAEDAARRRKGGIPPGFGWAPEDLDFTIRRLRPPRAVLGGEIWQVPQEEGKAEYRQR